MPNEALAAAVVAIACGMLALVRVRARSASAVTPIGILFDLDGTLLDFEGSSHDALNAPLVGKRFPGDLTKHVDWKLHASIVGKPKTAWSSEILAALHIQPHECTPEEYAQEWHDAIKADFPSMKLLPGALPLVRLLKQRFPHARLAIATSSEADNFRLKMAYHPDFLALFDAVVTGNEVQHGKPAPDIFLLAAQRLGVAAERCVVFEDSPSGVLAGKRAGCLTVAIPDGRMEGNEHAFAGVATVVLSSLQDLVHDTVALDALINRL